MPSTWRVHVIEQRLHGEGIRATVAECDLYSLAGSVRHAVLDAMIARQAEPPMVVVGEVVACHGDLDLDAVLRVAREAMTDGDCCC
jgi:hypothetical protein